MSSKYIGFDFDGCITESYSIMPIILFLEGLLPDEIRRFTEPIPPTVKNSFTLFKNRFYNRLALNEVKTGGTLIRPSFLKILPELLKQRSEHKIEKLFIYSNNQNHDLINAVDHILALTLNKLATPVPEAQLIKAPENGRLQTFEPRIHKTAPCRYSEKEQSDYFKEKTFQGIQTCLGKSISESELWFLDDTHDHVDLVNKLGLGRRYIETKKYEIKLKNPKLAEMIVLSFPKDCFSRTTLSGRIFMQAYSKLENIFIKGDPDERYLIKKNPRFNPVGTEDEKKLTELLATSLRSISPNVNIRSKDKWSVNETETDADKLRKALNMDYSVPGYLMPPPNPIESAAAYGETLQGGGRGGAKARRRITHKKKRKARGAK